MESTESHVLLSKEEENKQKNTWIGLIWIFVSIFTWLAISEFQNYLFNKSKSFPVFLTSYVQSSSSIIFFAINAYHAVYSHFVKTGSYESIDERSDSNLNVQSKDKSVFSFSDAFTYLRKYLIVFPCYLAANIASSYSFKYNSVSTNTVLFQSNTIFTFLISLFYGESSSMWKILSILFCCAGAVVTSWSNNGDSFDNFNFLVFIIIASAFTYSMFITSYHMQFSESHSDSFFILAVIGLLCAVTAWPVVLILHFSNLEHIPVLSLQEVGYIFLLGIGISFYNVCLGFALQKCSAVLVNAVCTTSIPLSIVADYLFQHKVFGAYFYVGATSIIIGFFMMLYAQYTESPKNRNHAN